MDKIIAICINIVNLLLLIVLVNDYSDALLVSVCVMFICYLCYMLFKFRKRYISKDVILTYTICVILQCIIVNVLEKIGIWKIGNSFMGLGMEELAVFFYFCLHFFFFVLLVLANCLKYIIIKVKNKEK